MYRTSIISKLLLFAFALSNAQPLHGQDRTNQRPTSGAGVSSKETAVRQFSGNRKTERAVAEGLEWLAAHQRSDGIWDRRGFDRCCPDSDRCGQTAVALLNYDADVAVSALVSLAFLGAGHTHEKGPYSENISRVFSYLLAQQKADGSFSTDRRFQTYGNALAAIAIAENYALSNDPILKVSLERVIRKLEQSQQAGGGWDCTDDLATRRNDTSITCWVLMAFKSADAAGVPVSVDTRMRLLQHFDRATMPDGSVWYADRTRSTTNRPSRELSPSERAFGPGLTAAGLYARLGLGMRLDEPLARRQINRLLDELPNLDEMDRPDSNAWYNEYYWYYGTLAMYHMGGEPWQKWNAALRRAVLEQQQRPVTRKGKHRHEYGSWPAFGRGWGDWGRSGGRLYATAINTMTLEVYYHNVPDYLSPRGLLGPIELRDCLRRLPPGRHEEIVALAARLHTDTGEPILLELLASPNHAARLAAALQLAELNSPMGLPILREAAAAAAAADASRRNTIESAISRVSQIPRNIEYGSVTEVNSQARMLLFDTNGKPLYYGQRLTARRDGQVFATLVVTRRFVEQKAAAAAIESSSMAIHVGDRIVSLHE